MFKKHLGAAAIIAAAAVVITGSALGGAMAAPPAPARPGLAASAGAVFLTPADVAAIKAKLADGHHPGSAAVFKTLVSTANKELSEGTYSVTKNGGRQGRDVYFTDSPYCWRYQGTTCVDHRDGQINPKADRKDYEEAIKEGHSVRDLGLAYALTGDGRYAARAVTLIKAWATDSSTRMNPKTVDLQSDIELSVTMPGLFYGASLVDGYSGWSSADKTAFQNWVRSLAGSITASTQGENNNIAAWRTALIAAAGGYLDDGGLLDTAYSRYRSLVPQQINSTGQMVKELRRSDSLSYSLYGINALSQIAEIADNHGTNLYDFSSDGKSLHKAFDYHAQYCVNPGSWRAGSQHASLPASSCAPYELAYTQWHSSAAKKVLDKYRPLDESRTMGPVSLTHSS